MRSLGGSIIESQNGLVQRDLKAHTVPTSFHLQVAPCPHQLKLLRASFSPASSTYRDGASIASLGSSTSASPVSE